MEFSNQEFHIQNSGSGRKLTECPILYYGIGGLYHLLGPNDWVFRGVNLLILFFGLFTLFKLTLGISKNLVLGLTLPFLIFSSPLISYYGPNFLPNVPAFSFSLIGIYLFYKYYKKNQLFHFYLAMIFFTLAGLIKLTSLVAFCLIFGFFLLETLGVPILKNHQKIFPQKIKLAPGFLLVVLITGGWAIGTKDAGTLIPYWDLDLETTKKTLNFIKKESLPEFFSPYTLALISVLGLINLSLPKKIGLPIYLGNILIIIGVLIIFFRLFMPLYMNNYYFIEFIILPLTILLTSIFLLKNNYPKLISNIWFSLSLIIFVTLNLIYAKGKLDQKYDFEGNEYSMYSRVHVNAKEIRNFLKENNIAYPDPVISAPDWSPNITLYIMNLLGWTELSSPHVPLQPQRVAAYGKCCAKYLIIHDKKYLEREDLKRFFNYPIASYKNTIFVFDLDYLKEK